MKLQSKIIITTVLTTLILNFSVQLLSYLQQKDVANQILNNKIKRYSRDIQNTYSLPLYLLDENILDKNLENLFNDPDIVSITLEEINGTIKIIYSKPHKDSSLKIQDNIDIYYDSDLIGRVRITYTTMNIESELNLLLQKYLFNLLLIITVFPVVLYFILKIIISPISKLADATIQIAKGNLEPEVPENKDDEIGILTTNFLLMRDSIKYQIKKLEEENNERLNTEKKLAKVNVELVRQKQNLEYMVNKRTSELQESLEVLKSTQEMLIESEKIASLGTIVAGVAHEINTPIGIGVTASSHLEEETKKITELCISNKITKTRFLEYTQQATLTSQIILSNLKKAANIINSFKQIAVDQSSEAVREFKIREYIDEILLSLHSKIKTTKHKIQVECTENYTLYNYPGAFSQILTNLIINSLIHGFENIDNGLIKIVVNKIGDDINIHYEDNGVGISKENLKKIFNPFFTTKLGSGGSGLGLSIVYNLVHKNLKGSIRCLSNPEAEEGTTFELLFPCDLRNTD